MSAGYRAPTAFEIIARPQHAEIWDGFRNVDYDRQARVLEVRHATRLRVWKRATGKALGAPVPFELPAARVGHNHTYIHTYIRCIYGIFGKLPYIRSYTVYIYGSGQPY
jgi:hypothetical protein